MTDIVERLRGWRVPDTWPLEEAADEIKRLREQNAALLAEGDRLRRQHAEFLEALQHLIDDDDEDTAKINQKPLSQR